MTRAGILLSLTALLTEVSRNGVCEAFSMAGRRSSEISTLPSSRRFSAIRACTIIQSTSNAATETEEIEWDEEEFELGENIESLGACHTKLTELAKSTSLDASAVEQATDLFDELYQAYLTTEDSALWPNTETYNLLMEVHAFSKAPDGAEHADLILKRLVNPPEGATLPPPDRKTYGLAMDAWMRRGELEQVKHLLEEMEASGREDIQPNIYTYNKVIQAYGMAGQPEQAERLLEELLEETKDEEDGDEASYDKINNPSRKPNQKTWVQTLRAYANPRLEDVDAGVTKIEEMIQRMVRGYRQGEGDWKPGTEAFNALLQGLSHSKGSAKEAERILYTLIEQYQDGDEEMKPSNDSFFHVLRAYRNEGGTGGAFKVEKLLQLQDALAQTDASLKPSSKVLAATIAAMSRARDSNKAVKAKRIFDRLKQESNVPLGIVPYKNLLNACAFTKSSNPEEKLATFQIAVDTLNEIRGSSHLSMDSSLFSLFLKACSTLMPPTKKRDAVVDSAFRNCCQEGYLNDVVLKEFKKGASEELHLKVMGGFLEDGVQPPGEWTRNAR